MQKETVEYTLKVAGDEEKKYNIAIFNTQKPVDFHQMAPPVQMKKLAKPAEDRSRNRKNKSDVNYRWHLHDGQGKNNFEGNLEAGQPGYYVILQKDGDSFKVTPVTHWFKFKPHNFKDEEIEEEEVVIKQAPSKLLDRFKKNLGKAKELESTLGDQDEPGQDVGEEWDYDFAVDDDEGGIDETVVSKEEEKIFSEHGKHINKLLREYDENGDDLEDSDEDELLESDKTVKPTTTTTVVPLEPSKSSQTKKRKAPDANSQVKQSKKTKVDVPAEASAAVEQLEGEMYEVMRKQLLVRDSIPVPDLIKLVKDTLKVSVDSNFKMALRRIVDKRLIAEEGHFRLKELP